MTTHARLSKHHGLGNDFLVALWTRNPDMQPRADLARAWCHRRRGIGADGVLWLLPPDRAETVGQMVLHNSDGSLAEISGNGIRCLAQAIAIDRGAATAEFVVQTAAGDRHLRVAGTERPGIAWADAEMGPVEAGPEAPPIESLGLTDVDHVGTGDVGNPHLVVAVRGAWQLDAAVHGPRIAASFPAGINVHFIESVEGRVRMRIWERGAGVTQACGSGATVVAHLARQWGMAAGDAVQIEMPGGVATVTDGARGPVLGSAVVHVADIDIGIDSDVDVDPYPNLHGAHHRGDERTSV